MRTIIEVCDDCHDCRGIAWKPKRRAAAEWLLDVSICLERSDGKVLFRASAKDRCPACVVSYIGQLREMAGDNRLEITMDRRELNEV